MFHTAMRPVRLGMIAACVVTAAGCMPQQPPLTTDEQALRSDADVFNETVAGGAAAGAALGGLTCLLLGGGAGDCVEEVALGAVVGGVAGYLTASKQEAANQQVAQIDIITRDIQAENAQAAKVVASARKVLDENRATAKAVRERIANQEVEVAEVAAMQAKLQSNVDVLNGVIAKLGEKRDTFAEAATSLEAEGQQTAGLQEQVREMEDQIALLVEYRTALEEELSVELMG